MIRSAYSESIYLNMPDGNVVKVMKPLIWKFDGEWRCGRKNVFVPLGCGPTEHLSYMDWLSQITNTYKLRKMQNGQVTSSR